MDKIEAMIKSNNIPMVKLGLITLLHSINSVQEGKEYLQSLSGGPLDTLELRSGGGVNDIIIFLKGDIVIAIYYTFIICVSKSKAQSWHNFDQFEVINYG